MEIPLDNLKIWFSADGKRIACTGSFFKLDNASYDQLIEIQAKLKKKLEEPNISRASDSYFLAVTSKLIESFESDDQALKQVTNE